MKHAHAELINLWADGAEIEYLGENGEWVSDATPRWYLDMQYRAKNSTMVARIALTWNSLPAVGDRLTVVRQDSLEEYENRPDFRKWVTPLIRLDL